EHAGDGVKKTGARDVQLEVSQNHPCPARMLHREALVYGRVEAWIAHDDLSGHLRGIEVVEQAEGDASGEGRSTRRSRIGRDADRARAHERKHRGACGERRTREGAAVAETDGTAEETVAGARRDRRDPRTRNADA